MDTNHSKSALVYGHVKRALQSGNIAPGQRIEPSAISFELSMSMTPVRFALYRHVGEELILDQGRDGFHIPLPNELDLRELYGWMDRLLLMAYEMSQEADRPVKRRQVTGNGDIVRATAHLFEAIARSGANRHFVRCVRRYIDRLAPFRRMEQSLIDDAARELSALRTLWNTGHSEAVQQHLRVYHERRQALVPRLIELIGDDVDSSQ